MKKILVNLLFCLPLFAFSQTYLPKSITISGKTVEFLEFLPKNFDPTGNYRYPVIIFFQGQERVKDGYKSTTGEWNSPTEIQELNAEGLPKFLAAGASMEFTNLTGGLEAFIVLVPWKNKDLEWYPSQQVQKQPGDQYQVERQYPPYIVDAMLAHASTLNASRSRVFLTGLSLGGGITWDYPSFSDVNAANIAGIVPVSGRPVYAYNTPASGIADICNIPEHGVASRAYLGNSDGVIPLSDAEKARDHVNNICANNSIKKRSELKILPGGHNAAFWNTVYDPAFHLGDTSLNMYQWMLAVTAGTEASLPVVLTHFKGKNLGEANILEWGTSAEVNFDRFELLRSADGKNFVSIGSIAAQSTATGNKGYTFKDNQAPKGVSHYQLKQVDKDGRFKLSKVITVNNKNQAFVVEKYPNPATSQLNISVEGNIFGAIEFQVVDLKGNVVRKMAIRKDQTSWNGIIDVRTLANGMYILQMNASGGKKEVTNFIKK